MSSTYGQNIKISIFGQSHSEAIGVTVDGLPSGFSLDMDALQRFLSRRAPGGASFSTQRREADIPEFVSGLVDGVTCGAPLTALIRNKDTRSSDYSTLKDVPRPSHADFTAHIKYRGAQDVRGGGHFSGRLTAPLCVAGGICLQLLKQEGVDIAAHIYSVGKVNDRCFDPVRLSSADFDALRSAPFPVLDEEAGVQMREAIDSARRDGDSVGGVIECAAVGVPAGLGEPMFDGMENRIASIVFGIPAVKGLEFGNGFAGSGLRGSENNDSFYMDRSVSATPSCVSAALTCGAVRTRTNNHGGILGGITSGMPVIFRAAVKPTPSIAKEQLSVSFSGKTNVKLTIKGRHDPCIVPRAVPVIEAAAAIALFDALLENKKYEKGAL